MGESERRLALTLCFDIGARNALCRSSGNALRHIDLTNADVEEILYCIQFFDAFDNDYNIPDGTSD